MKKTYIAPKLELTEVNMDSVLAGSIGVGENINGDVTGIVQRGRRRPTYSEDWED